MTNPLPSGLLQGIKYLEDTYKTHVQVWESSERPWHFYLYLHELPQQEFTKDDIMALSNCNCYRSQDNYSHFYMVL